MIFATLGFAFIIGAVLRATYVWAFNSGLDEGIKFGVTITMSLLPPEAVVEIDSALRAKGIR